MPDEFVLSEQNHEFIRSQKWEVAVIGFGATEPHNLHMPYGTDVFQVDVVGRAACKHAYERGAKVLQLPTLPFGVIPLTLAEAYLALADETGRSAE